DQKNLESTHPWGIDESIAVKFFKEKIKTKKEEKPFFIQFLTNSTHYPYTSPYSKKGGDYSKYQGSLRYTDKIIDDLIQTLAENSLLDDTRIFIIGDHGEAFGN